MCQGRLLHEFVLETHGVSSSRHADIDAAATPNSNAVGMVGAFVGGGSSAWNGIHGFAIDNVLSIRLVTASCSILTLAPGSSDPDEAALFNALCGAGHGL